MYLQFFGFTREPFHITPDPEVLYLGPTHREALATIARGVENRLGLIEIVGDVGLGKTTILRSFLEGVDTGTLRPIVLFNPVMTFAELLRTIYRELDREFPAVTGQPDMLIRFREMLVEEYRSGRHLVIVIDEAQNIPVETLEQLCLFSDLRANGVRLLQVVLAGQPELDRKMNGEGMKTLRRKVALRAEIQPLTPEESLEYIGFRLSKAGGAEGQVFTRAAMTRIVSCCRGIPRLINILCDNALITAYGYTVKPVPRNVVDEVIADLHWHYEPPPRRWIPVAAAVGLSLLAVFALVANRGLILAGFDELRAAAVSYGDYLYKAWENRSAGNEARPPAKISEAPVDSRAIASADAKPAEIQVSAPVVQEEKPVLQPTEKRKKMPAGPPKAPVAVEPVPPSVPVVVEKPVVPESPPPERVEAPAAATVETPPSVPEAPVVVEAVPPSVPVVAEKPVVSEPSPPERVEAPAAATVETPPSVPEAPAVVESVPPSVPVMEMKTAVPEPSPPKGAETPKASATEPPPSPPEVPAGTPSKEASVEVKPAAPVPGRSGQADLSEFIDRMIQKRTRK